VAPLRSTGAPVAPMTALNPFPQQARPEHRRRHGDHVQPLGGTWSPHDWSMRGTSRARSARRRAGPPEPLTAARCSGHEAVLRLRVEVAQEAGTTREASRTVSTTCTVAGASDCRIPRARGRRAKLMNSWDTTLASPENANISSRNDDQAPVKLPRPPAPPARSRRGPLVHGRRAGCGRHQHPVRTQQPPGCRSASAAGSWCRSSSARCADRSGGLRPCGSSTCSASSTDAPMMPVARPALVRGRPWAQSAA
jgi:hypothetical protein